MVVSSDLHIDAALSRLSVKSANDMSNFVASKILPTVRVQKESDRYYVYGRENFILENTFRADGAPANEATYGMNQSTYQLEEYALADIVTDRMRKNADPALDPESDAVINLTEKLMIDYEIRTRNLMFTTTALAQNHAAGVAWSAQTTTSDPFVDVNTATAVILRQTGARANTMLIGQAAFQSLKNHSDTLDRIKYSERGIITADLLAAMFDLDQVLVGRAVFNSAQEGAAESMGYIWATHALLAYVEKNPGLRTKSAGVTFGGVRQTGDTALVSKWREEKRKGDMVEVSWMLDEAITNSGAAYLITSV